MKYPADISCKIERQGEAVNYPDLVESHTHRVYFGCGHLYITIDKHEGKPVRSFLKVGKIGVCRRTLLETIGRLVTIMLQEGISLERIHHTLMGQRCDQGIAGPGKLSCVDALGKELQSFLIKETEK